MEHPLTLLRKARKQTLEAFANDLGASKGTLWKWENRKAIPRPEYMRKIVEVSNGSVTANDWYTEAAQ